MKDERQPMLVKFCCAETLDDILKARRALKDTGFAVFEDTTPPNIKLLNRLYKFKEETGKLENSWFARGKVWALTDEKVKVNIEINDNIEKKINKAPSKQKDTKQRPSTITKAAADIPESSLPDQQKDTSSETDSIPDSKHETSDEDTEEEVDDVDPETVPNAESENS